LRFRSPELRGSLLSAVVRANAVAESPADALKWGCAPYSSKMAVNENAGPASKRWALTEQSMSAVPLLRPLRIFAIAAMLACLSVPVLAQALPDAENGRYALTPMGGGFIRLDTRTGVVSQCEDKGSGWRCYALPEEHVALDQEIGRLQAENEKLKAQLAAREPTTGGKTRQTLPKSESSRPGEPGATAPKADGPKSADANRNSIEIPLPSDRDMDRVMSFVERAWRRLIEMAGRVQRDRSGGI
jgi:hypothetical protein